MTQTQPDLVESDDPYLLGTGEAEQLLAGAGWTRFAVVGDSIAEGVMEAIPGYRPLPWADRVAEALREANPALDYRNLGTRNLTASQVRAAQLGPVADYRPDLAAVLIGGNDILQPKFDGDLVEAEYARILSTLRSRKCTVVTMGLFDITHSPFVAEKYREVMRERLAQLAKHTAAVTYRLGGIYVDLPAHPAATEAIYSSDGLHLNGRGHAIVATEVIRALGRALGNASAA